MTPDATKRPPGTRKGSTGGRLVICREPGERLTGSLRTGLTDDLGPPGRLALVLLDGDEPLQERSVHLQLGQVAVVDVERLAAVTASPDEVASDLPHRTARSDQPRGPVCFPTTTVKSPAGLDCPL